MDLQAVVSRIMLCTLSRGVWSVVKKHAGETRAENQRHATDAARVLVRVTDCPSYAAVVQNQNAAYAVHESMTLPGCTTGVRVLPIGRRSEHADRMRVFADENERLVAAFLGDYDQERYSAPSRLNGLYDARHWPDRSVVAAKFRFETRYLPVPQEGDWLAWIAESAKAAEMELQERLQAALSRVKTRCGGDGKLYATVFSELRDVLALCPAFDSSPTLSAVAAMATPLAALNAEALRDDKRARQAAADSAANMLAALGGNVDATDGGAFGLRQVA